MPPIRFRIQTAMAVIAESGVLMGFFVWAFRDDPGVIFPIFVLVLAAITYVTVRLRQSTRQRKDSTA